MDFQGERIGRWKRALALLAWCLPAWLAYAGYRYGIRKLAWMTAWGATFLKWDEKTEFSINLTLWFHAHRWVFAIPLALTIAAFFIPTRRKAVAFARLGVLVCITVTCLWSFKYGLYLGGKLIDLPRLRERKTESPTSSSNAPPAGAGSESSPGASGREAK